MDHAGSLRHAGRMPGEAAVPESAGREGMLTQSEKRWLDNRGKFSCWYCPDIPQAMCTMGERPAHCAIMDTDWKEAAEFSERVGARLARMMLRPNEYKYPCRDGVPELGCMRDMTALTGSFAVHCEDCILRKVRLQVEVEMDNDI